MSSCLERLAAGMAPANGRAAGHAAPETIDFGYRYHIVPTDTMNRSHRLFRALGSLAPSLSLCAALFALSGPAQAHQVWLEADARGTKFYFGEFGDNLHEASPGYLDKLTQVSALLVSRTGERPLAAEKERDGFRVAGRPASGESLLVEDRAYPMMESTEGSKTTRTAWTPAARFVPELGPRAPKLMLDVVPTNASGDFRVYYRGAPLPKVAVTLVAVSGWSISGNTDADGKVSFRLPWKGSYALLVRHKDPSAGTRKSVKGETEAFDGQSFATTLTFATSEGLPSPPAPPPAPPNTP
jgi:hypothetical protein